MVTTADYLINRTNPATAGNGLALFNAGLLRGWLKRMGAMLMKRDRSLRQLRSSEGAVQRLAGAQLAAVRDIAIRDIVGSEDRCGDFDSDFNPLREALRDRWLSVFSARQRGVSLPPIELVRGPDGYYVRDGHHRLSVARALGQEQVEASVVAYLERA